MDPRTKRTLVVATAMGATMVAAAIGLYLTAPSTEVAGPPAAAPLKARAPSSAPATRDPGMGATPDEALEAVIVSGHPDLPPSSAAFSDPEQAEAFVRSKVVDLLAAIAPEIRPADVTEECSDDGRTCTFTGPWPGDDLLKRWIKAISDGRTGEAAMGGVKFSKLTRGEDEQGRPTLVIEARAP